MSMWAMWSSNLILGIDIRKISNETLEILKNKDIIQINQDSLVSQGKNYNYIEI